MTSHCEPRLISDVFDDPGLFIRFPNQPGTVLLDAGSLNHLTFKDLSSITHLYVSHTHMDHFIGFDHLVRVLLGRGHRLDVTGPEGIIDQVRRKLAGYRWNLVAGEAEPLVIDVTEIANDHLLHQTFSSADRFIPAVAPVRLPARQWLTRTPVFRTRGVILDHDTPCVGYAVEETDHVRILPDGLKACHLAPGKWITRFKAAVQEHGADDTLFEIDDDRPGHRVRRWTLDTLSRRIAAITPGRKVAYITDVAYTADNRRLMAELARHADPLFIEAAFLEQDRDIAARKCHLTAAQAGELAGRARARGFVLFHHSPRYRQCPERFREEAEQAYARVAHHGTAHRNEGRRTP